RTVIFVNGCFWHKHDCRRFQWPQSNAEYWVKKITGNVSHDKRNHKLLHEQGWKVIVLWECELTKGVREVRLQKLQEEIIRKEG
ncbi:MAG: very short patch repair endonuclease, partial [Clostridiales bacterium]|nr:very short patch repair endonuclease [Clostridiales bacterium]